MLVKLSNRVVQRVYREWCRILFDLEWIAWSHPGTVNRSRLRRRLETLTNLICEQQGASDEPAS